MDSPTELVSRGSVGDVCQKLHRPQEHPMFQGGSLVSRSCFCSRQSTGFINILWLEEHRSSPKEMRRLRAGPSETEVALLSNSSFSLAWVFQQSNQNHINVSLALLALVLRFAAPLSAAAWQTLEMSAEQPKQDDPLMVFNQESMVSRTSLRFQKLVRQMSYKSLGSRKSVAAQPPETSLCIVAVRE